MDNRHIIVFDGVCSFCNGAVLFIIKRDPMAVFAFTPMQSATAGELMVKYQVSAANLDADTVLLIKNEVCYIRSEAVLEIVRDLTGMWSLLRIFRILPVPIRDYLYRLFARNRYTLFGKRDCCMVPGAEIRSRFLE